jgi:hypothetical protein
MANDERVIFVTLDRVMLNDPEAIVIEEGMLA